MGKRLKRVHDVFAYSICLKNGPFHLDGLRGGGMKASLLGRSLETQDARVGASPGLSLHRLCA
jgi:hypothetical protein